MGGAAAPERNAAMKKASEYRQYAKECRELARWLHNNEHRVQLLDTASMWEQFAEGLVAVDPAERAGGDEHEIMRLKKLTLVTPLK